MCDLLVFAYIVTTAIVFFCAMGHAEDKKEGVTRSVSYVFWVTVLYPVIALIWVIFMLLEYPLYLFFGKGLFDKKDS